MSYIRNGSNPEKLYIWGDGRNACICEGKKDMKYIPQKIFNGLLKKYNKNYFLDDEVKYKGASIKEVYIERKGKPNKLDKLLGWKSGCFKMRLSYKQWYIDMWSVTWHYIACRRK